MEGWVAGQCVDPKGDTNPDDTPKSAVGSIFEAEKDQVELKPASSDMGGRALLSFCFTSDENVSTSGK